MSLVTERYEDQAARWPGRGRGILAQYDERSVVVYQAYRPEIGRFAAEHGYFGDGFSLSRMSWVKPNFLWMMFRYGWERSRDRKRFSPYVSSAGRSTKKQPYPVVDPEVARLALDW